jgi:hypothetical protein
MPEDEPAGGDDIFLDAVPITSTIVPSSSSAVAGKLSDLAVVM